ncbi:pectin acetylesterase 8-like [Solanum dulcamara]|uniref:pectin acetylesterase 8-like n=1 Tax=Solanum dulcamara TaxID=45834 RepID=UPI0024857798|nr:pectin acetylesterase 8-like [Solanum dulcamara]
MMVATRSFKLVLLLLCSLTILLAENTPNQQKDTSIDEYFIEKTIVKNVVSKGAVCLDGTPPAYYMDRGFGEGAQSWMIHLSGGGWCRDVSDCQNRSRTSFGSSKLMGTFKFRGHFSKNKSANPDLFNWNKVMVAYCDGGAFTGDVERVDPATDLHFRGARIFSAVMEDLLSKGLKDAKNALLIGSSAGAYPAMLYCDRFSKLLINTPRIKCLTDSGYFVDVNKTLQKGKSFEPIYKALVTLHGSAKALPKSCTSRMKPELCFFPQNIQQDIKTPLYTIMSPFDIIQVGTTLGDYYNAIKQNNFSANQKKNLRELRLELLTKLPNASDPKLRGAFIDSQFHHTRLLNYWKPQNVSVVNNVTMIKAFGDWYFDRQYYYLIDKHDLPIP